MGKVAGASANSVLNSFYLEFLIWLKYRSPHLDNPILISSPASIFVWYVITHLENNVELRVEVRLEALSLQDRLKLVQKLQGVLDRGDVFEALVDECLQEGGIALMKNASVD